MAPCEDPGRQTSGEFRDAFCLELADLAGRADADALHLSEVSVVE